MPEPDFSEVGWERCRCYLTAVARRRFGAEPGDPDRVTDLVQQTLLAALQSLRRGRGPTGGPDRILPWLRRILINQHLKQSLHERHHAVGLATPQHDRALEDLAQAHDDGAAGHAADPQLTAALRTLSRRDRRLLLWRLGRGRTLAEIGDRLSMTPAGARKAIEQALRRLRHAYHGHTPVGLRGHD